MWRFTCAREVNGRPPSGSASTSNSTACILDLFRRRSPAATRQRPQSTAACSLQNSQQRDEEISAHGPLGFPAPFSTTMISTHCEILFSGCRRTSLALQGKKLVGAQRRQDWCGEGHSTSALAQRNCRLTLLSVDPRQCSTGSASKLGLSLCYAVYLSRILW